MNKLKVLGISVILLFSSTLTGCLQNQVKENNSPPNNLVKLSNEPEQGKKAIPINQENQSNQKLYAVKEGTPSLRVEVKNRRTTNSRTFKNENGTHTTEISLKPIFYKDEKGELVSIENTIVEDSAKGELKNKSNSIKTTFPKKYTKNASLVTITDDDASISLIPVGEDHPLTEDVKMNVQEVQSTYKDNRVLYKGIYPNVDIGYAVASDEIKEGIILHVAPNKENTVKFTFELKLTGLDYKQQNNGSILLISKKTKAPVYILQSPFMVDSSIPEGYIKEPEATDFPETAISYDVNMNVINKGNKLFVEILPNSDWIEDPKRVFPITIDPSIVKFQPKTLLEDTNIRSLYPTQTAGSETTLGMGISQTNTIRSLMRFDVSSIPVGAKIQNAELNLWLASVFNDTPINIDIHELTKSWTENGANWNTRDGTNAWVTKGGDYLANIAATREISSLSTSNFRWNITNLVNKWVYNPDSNNGILLKSKSETTPTYKKFYSGDETSNVSKSPLLAVTYYPASRLGLEDFWTYDSQPLSEGFGYTNLTTGNNIIQFTDFSIPSRGGFGIDFTRTYNSKSVDDSPLGYGWTFVGNETVLYTPTERIYTDSDGTTHVFTLNQTTQTWTPPNGVYLSLADQINQNGYIIGFFVTDKFGTKTYFEVEPSDYVQVVSVATIKYSEDLFGNRVTYQYDSNRKLERIIDPSGRPLVFTYNTNGKIQTATFGQRQYRYSYIGTKLQKVEQLKNVGEGYTTTVFEYNLNGYLNQILDPNGRRTDFTYTDEFLSKTQPPSLTSASDVTDRPGVNYVYDITNKEAEVTDPNGKKTVYYSNENFVPVKIVDPALGETNFVLDKNYNPLEIIDPMGYRTYFTYDSKGNILTSKNADGHVSTYTYGPFSNMLTNQDPMGQTVTKEYGSKGELQYSVTPKGEKTSYTYDSYGNVKTVTYPNQTIEKFEYDTLQNYVTSILTNTDKRLFTAVHDDVGNIISFKDADGNETSTPNNFKELTQNVKSPDITTPTQYAYDNTGNLSSIIDANTHPTTFKYNGLGQVTEMKDALLNPTAVEYDASGNEKLISYPKGQKLSFTYTPLDQIEEIRVNNVLAYRYEYDKNGNIKKITDSRTGRIKNYDYCPSGLLKFEGDTISGSTFTYNTNDYLTNVAVDTGSYTINLGYIPNENNQLASLRKNGSAFANFSYTSLGLLNWKSYLNGLYFGSDYDSENRLKTYNVTDAKGVRIHSYTVGYDTNNNIKTITTPSGTITYEYDSLNQLVSETTLEGSNISYTYDNVGNRLTKRRAQGGQTTTTTYAYNAANQINSINGVSYTYDANGNVTFDGTYRYVYNDFDQLTEVRNASNTLIMSYKYDEEGRRISKTNASGITTNFHYLYDKIIYETNTSGTVLTEYTWDDQGNPITMTTGGTTYYYHVNHYGDVVALSDAAGTIVANYTYDAFGNHLSATGPMAYQNPFRYAGYRYDAESGLYYLMARYYNPNHGVFYTKDPYPSNLNRPITINQYVYAENNPIMNVDPDGRRARSRIMGTVKLLTGTYVAVKTAPIIIKSAVKRIISKGTSKTLNLSNANLSKWNKGSFKSAGDSAVKHFEKHGKEVGAGDVAQYIRKAEGFAQNLRGATKSNVSGKVPGVVRYKKSGKYIDLAPDGTIISFGKQ